MWWGVNILQQLQYSSSSSSSSTLVINFLVFYLPFLVCPFWGNCKTQTYANLLVKNAYLAWWEWLEGKQEGGTQRKDKHWQKGAQLVPGVYQVIGGQLHMIIADEEDIKTSE